MELFTQAFRGNYNKLVKEIDVTHGLWIELKSRNVLTPEQLRDCKSYVCHCAKYSYVGSSDTLVLYDSSSFVEREIRCDVLELYLTVCSLNIESK